MSDPLWHPRLDVRRSQLLGMLASRTRAPIRIRVKYYNEDERLKLLTYPTADQIQGLVKQGVAVPPAEFLTYYLFHRKRSRKPGYRSFDEIIHKIVYALYDLAEWVEFDGESLRCSDNVEHQRGEVTEHIAEAVSLSVVNRIHGITQADWGPIPVHPGPTGAPTFDYEYIGSDGIHSIQVESKGSALVTIEGSGAIATQKRKLDQKKQRIQDLERMNLYPHPANLRYGAICVLSISDPLTCLLTDPYSAETYNPRKTRLVNRLRFIGDYLSYLRPRSPLSASLSTRIESIVALNEPEALERVPLMRRPGEPFELRAPRAPGSYQWLGGFSRVVDGPVAGSVIQLTRDFLYFIGVRDSLIELAAEQNFTGIISYRAATASTDKTVLCSISDGRFNRMQLPSVIRERARRSGTYWQFELRGVLHYSPEGVVHGLLPLDEA